MKRNVIWLLLAGILLTGMASCKNKESVINNPDEDKMSVESSDSEDFSDYAEMDDEDEDIKMDTTYMDAYTDFAVSLLKNTVNQDKNSMVSPLSAATALTLVQNGATGDTLKQMQHLFGDLSVKKQNKNLIGFSEQLTDNDVASLKQANAVWINKISDFSINASYLSNVQKQYKADIKQEKFSEKTVNNMNEWVEQKTNGKITSLFKKINKEDRMYLLNALAFQAKWMQGYEKEDVGDGEFHAQDGTTQKVKMMSGTEQGFLEDDMTTGFMKKYKDGYRFVALLPKENIDIDTFISKMNGEKLTTLLQNVNARDSVDTQMPKFTFSYSIKLKKTLEDMGVKDVFNYDKAELGGLGTCTDGALCIAEINQKTFIHVDENGAEAAAATEVEIIKETAMQVGESKKVILDRPFVYAILDEKTELPIFMGVVKKI